MAIAEENEWPGKAIMTLVKIISDAFQTATYVRYILFVFSKTINPKETRFFNLPCNLLDDTRKSLVLRRQLKLRIDYYVY